jgi:hypothetical protein
MENAPFPLWDSGEGQLVAGGRSNGPGTAHFRFCHSTQDCIKMSAEREASRQCCASGFQVREMHRLFHKTVEKAAGKNSCRQQKLVGLCFISLDNRLEKDRETRAIQSA